MTLDDIIADIEEALSYSPNVQAHRDAIARKVNRKYLAISSAKNYDFLYREDDVPLYASDGPFAGTQSGYVITLSAATPQAFWAGATITFESSVAPGTTLTALIAKVSGSTIYIGFTLGAGPYTISDLKVYFPQFVMARDVQEVLGAKVRSSEKDVEVYSMAREQRQHLNDDDEGDVAAIIQDSPDAKLESPKVSPSLAGSAAAGSLTVGTTYSYMYTFSGYGLESGRSKVVKHKVASGEDTITVTLPSQSFLDMRVYRLIEDRWTLLGTVTPGNTTLVDGDADDSVQSFDVTDSGFFEPNPRLAYRPWPIPESQIESSAKSTAETSASETLAVRVKRLVRRLEHGTEIPVWDQAHHALLVHAVAMEMGASDPSLYRFHAAEFKRMFREFKNRHLSEAAIRHIKGLRGLASFRGVPR